MDDKVMESLYQTFNLKTRQGSGGTFNYVPNEDVINRMNEVFKGNWSTEVLNTAVIEEQVLIQVKVSVHDPITCLSFSHVGFGSHQIMRYTKGPNAGKIIDLSAAYKSALSKAIVYACTRWGVGLYKESNQTHKTADVPKAITNTQVTSTAPAVSPFDTVGSTPQANTATAITPPANTAVTVPIPPIPTTTAASQSAGVNTNTHVAPPAQVEVDANTHSAPPMPAGTKTTTFNPAPPMPGQTVSANINVKQEPMGSNPNILPNFPKPSAEKTTSNSQPQMSAPPTPAVPATPMTTSAAMPQSGLDAIGISDVQRVALNGILSMHNVKYKDLAKEAFEKNDINKEIPPKENLTYDEAVVIIKYGNDKYRSNR